MSDLRKRIKKMRLELEECRRKDLSEAAVKREQVVRYKLGRLEEQLDIFWRQRAHVGWLTKGDCNRDYFHGFVPEDKETE